MAGTLPTSKIRLVQAWIEIHREELMADWELAVNGQPAVSDRSAALTVVKHSMEVPAIIKLLTAAPSILRVTYVNGQVRDFDCAPYLERGVFVRLKDPALFAQAYLAHGTVCWPGALDIAPETVFLRSVLVKTQSPLHTIP